MARPDQAFCGMCGASLTAVAEPGRTGVAEGVVRSAPDVEAAPGVATGELRWVSVVFVDLVGFTRWSEGRDPELVRELLSGYFSVAKTIVGRYGGVVEKFIGDAVMAVWGAAATSEDDAERAVRAGLELVAAVQGYGSDRGVPGLRARAGVVTGQVAAWVAPGEGLVSGDRVNTAARAQAVAEPGSVLVDAATRQGSQAAVTFEPAGTHVVKGKTEPLVLWRAVRVVAGVAGAHRVDGLEAPLVGRARELGLVKELFHGCVEQGRARVVVVSGEPGVGKSRLGWEFEKYVDGLTTTVWWHRGRCLAYGDGVALWALAQMVRQRFDIAQGESAVSAGRKLAEGLARLVPDEAERDFVFPRLAVLLFPRMRGLVARDSGFGVPELFAGWRLFVERMAAAKPVVLVVEDAQWADSGLVDFVDHLAQWSAGLPIFVLGLTRPELTERYPGWLADRRNATTVHLGALSRQSMQELVDGLVPGLPAPVRARVVDRAGGNPLFAVETIRSLVDRDLVVAEGGGYVVAAGAGDVGDLDVPVSLTALLASRLDQLGRDERDLVKGLAVLGGSFTRDAVAAVTDLPAEVVDELLRSLVRKEVVTVRDDPLSPERGAYAFAQTMLRAVAHDLVTRRERRTLHLAVARHLRASFPDDGEEVAEVVAAHYVQAHDAAAGTVEEEQLRAEAVAALARAGRHARTVGSPDVATRAYLAAADLATDEAEVTELRARAAETTAAAGRHAGASARSEDVRVTR